MKKRLGERPEGRIEEKGRSASERRRIEIQKDAEGRMNVTMPKPKSEKPTLGTLCLRCGAMFTQAGKETICPKCATPF